MEEISEVITFNEYNDSLNSIQHLELVKLIQERFKIPRQRIDEIMDSYFDLDVSIKKNYKNLLEAIERYLTKRRTNKELKFFQPSLF